MALEVGYRHIDTATMYGNEAEVGRALRDSGVDRAEVFITTKLPPERAGRERRTIDASLKALGVDHLDLWLIHWPPRGRSTEVWQEFIAARDEGLTRAIGVSNYSIRPDRRADQGDRRDARRSTRSSGDRRCTTRTRPPRTAERGVVLEGYSPFKTTNLRRHQCLVGIAEAHGVTPAQVVLRWHIQHEFVVIPKSVTPDRIRTNFDVVRLRAQRRGDAPDRRDVPLVSP